jgi:arginyl-tRNA synthetase
VAEQIKAKLDLGEVAEETSIAGPGFINVKLSAKWLAKQLKHIEDDPRLGVEKSAAPQRVVVDYSGPNVAKELHVGHLRSTIIGDALVRVLEFLGDTVIRQNHVGDWGTQFGMLIAFLKERGNSGETSISDLDAFYKEAKKRFDADPAFQDEARRTVVRLQAGEAEERRLWQQIVEETRRHYQPLYQYLGVKLTTDDERGESFYNAMLPTIVSDLVQSGIAAESEGAIVVFIAGNENPLIVQKTGGGYLYGTTDLAALRYRVGELHAQRIIYLTDARQAQHFSQVFATARRAGWAGATSLEHAPFGSVLGEDRKPFKARSGESVKLKELLQEAESRAYQTVTQKNPEIPEARRRQIARAVGIGAVKYADLSNDRVGDYIFSWDKMLALDGNTAPYLQYAHARIRSIFRRATERGIELSHSAKVELQLNSPYELRLAKQILRLGEVARLVARDLKPHHLASYLYELATQFSGFFENCPVIQSEEPLRSSRLMLCDLTGRTLALGLDLLGIEHPDEM